MIKIQLIESTNSNATTAIKLVELAGTSFELAFIHIYNVRKNIRYILNIEQTFWNSE